jgi:hypothetical protein
MNHLSAALAAAVLVVSINLSHAQCERIAGAPAQAGPAAALPPSEYTLIGNSKVLRRGVVELGDIDGNGVMDYAWTSPTEDHSRGAVRLFLMATPRKALSIRHIVPGKWGFSTPALRKDDRFGTSISMIGDVNGDGVQDLAVGAPGDSDTGKGKGAVYVLLMTKDGSVLRSEKISASTEITLQRQHAVGEGFGTAIHAVQDVNGDNVKELSVESADGSRTLVLLRKTGRSISGMKFAAGVDPKDLEPRILKGKIRVMPLRIDTMSDSTGEFRPAARAASQCFFNETACACAKLASTATCYDTVESKNGRTVCAARSCQAGYKCDCTGTQLCRRTETTVSNYMALPGAAAGPGLVFCAVKESTMVRTELIEGASLEAASGATSARHNVWTPTQCSCTSKASLTSGASECLDFVRQARSGPICTVRPCKKTPGEMVCDIGGSSVCDRATTSRPAYVKTGATTASGEAPCAQEIINVEAVTCVERC